jgi:putative toxin-antitoxin system antitoxin component (TIGR02293 family)
MDLYWDYQSSMFGYAMSFLTKKLTVPTTPSVRVPLGASPAFQGDTSDQIRRMRTGISVTVVADIANRLGIRQENLYQMLKLPASAIKNHLNKRGMLSAVEQDRMYRVDRVFNRTVEVLEDASAASTWIKQPNRALGGEAPLSLLDTEVGYELVLDTLGRIEHGVVS